MCKLASIVVAGLLGLAGLAACAPAPTTPAASPTASASAPAAPGDELQTLIDGARQEGQLVLVWSENTAGGSEGIRRWTEGFNRLYGLNLTVQFTPGPSMPEVAAKVSQEYQAGRPATSDILTGAETLIASLIEANVLEPVDWQSWAPNIRDPRLLAPGGTAVAAASRAPGITYNTQRLTGDAVPTTLQDLLKPRYKGRIASTSYAAFWDRVATPEIWGEQRTIDYVTRLADQVAGLTRCGESERLATGEFDLLAIDCGGDEARKGQAAGAPLGYVIPSDAAMVAYWYMAVPRNARHPNTAKLWINYVLSREGQDVLYQLAFTDQHLVPGSKTVGDIEALQARGIKVTELGVDFVQRNGAQDLARLQDDMRRILQKQ
ncbi:MAG TPA: ABC transporter substrate-binding protein [Chloroflexota bacterium]